jgi:hypothetical protein
MPRFTLSDLLLGTAFIALVCGAVANVEGRWAFLVFILPAIVCGVVLLGRLQRRN